VSRGAKVPRSVVRSVTEVLERTGSFAEVVKHYDRAMAAEAAKCHGTRCPGCGQATCECEEP